MGPARTRPTRLVTAQTAATAATISHSAFFSLLSIAVSSSSRSLCRCQWTGRVMRCVLIVPSFPRRAAPDRGLPAVPGMGPSAVDNRPATERAGLGPPHGSAQGGSYYPEPAYRTGRRSEGSGKAGFFVRLWRTENDARGADYGGVSKQMGPDPSAAGAYHAKLGRPTLAASGLGIWDRRCHQGRRSLYVRVKTTPTSETCQEGRQAFLRLAGAKTAAKRRRTLPSSHAPILLCGPSAARRPCPR
jgi:hypothetical protein